MAPIKQRLHILMLLLICSYSIDTAANHNTTVPCLPDQASSLLQLKRSFIDANLSSWRAGTDCCHWEGVTCDMALGRVISLDLGEFYLLGRRLDPALFNLTSLQNLSLAQDFFGKVHLPESGFERLTDIIHLNFSNTNFLGQIPIGIACLKNLVTLDFSGNIDLYFQEPSFQTFMANLSNLRELYLDEVGIFSNQSTWSIVLADSVPQLQELCGISGSIHPSLARLRSLTVIKLGYNWGLTGKVPEFFAALSSLSILDISGSYFEGRFPTKIFQRKSLRTLDLSLNPSLSVSLPDFPVGNNLETLNLAWINFSCDIPPSFANLNSLKNLGLSTTGIPKELPSIISKLPSLTGLQLFGSSLEKPVLSWIGNLTQLTDLYLDTYDFSQSVPSWIGDLTSLASLRIWRCNFPRSTPYQIGNLANLTILEFAFCYFYGQRIPSWIGNLTKLTSLGILECNFSGPIPSTIGNLTQLEDLQIAFNNINGQIPKSLFALPALQSLDLESNQLSGSLEEIPAPSSSPLSRIGLYNNQLTGPIPKSFFLLKNLECLSLEVNRLTGTVELGSFWRLKSLSFLGQIPKSLFALPALQYLDLDLNQLSGSLEEIPAASSSPLLRIGLYDNQLTGQIPKSFFLLKNLEYLALDKNRLTGTVELGSFWRLKSLSFLSLSNNMLSIVDEEGDNVLPSLPNINYLDLASCNLTKLPGALRYLKLLDLDLSGNQISGVIPSWVWENGKDNLNSLNLSCNMFTTLERSPCLVHMPYLTVLDLSFNRLQGSIPIPVTSYPGVVLDYSNNYFSTIVPNFGRYLRNTVYINLSNNRLSGQIPSSICSASELDIMDLSYNNFSGSVPPCLIESGNLSVLKLRENRFHGMLPENIREGCNLRTIDLNGNRIEGKLPRSLSNCQDLELLDVGNNQIVDSFPSWLGILPKLRVLVLRSNQLNGTIGDIKGGHRLRNHFTSLQIVDLASNHFSGDLHSEWFENLQSMMKNDNDRGQILEHDTNVSTIQFYRETAAITYKGDILMFTKILTTLKVIDFSNNSFGGPIPKSMGKLISLCGLNMSHNAFTGQIPSQLSALTQLESLDLSWNKLSGEIPQELTSLTSLAWLNLSYNNLTGRIPQGNQFLSFPSSSFKGNLGLCGIPLSKQCDTPGSTTTSASTPPEPNTGWQDRLGVILLFTFVGLGLGVGFASAVLFQLFCRIEGWNCKH